MPNPNQVSSQATVTIDGIKYPTSGETSCELGGATREAVPGDYDASSFSEKIGVGKVEVTILQKVGVNLAPLRDAVDATVVVQYDTGKTYILRNAYSTEGATFGQDGKAKVTFQGPPMEEVV